MRKPSTLYIRLMVAALVPLIVAVAGAWALASVVFTRTLEARVLDQTRHATAVLSATRLPLTVPLLGRFADLQDAELLLLGADGRVAASTYPVVPTAVAEAVTRLSAQAPGREDVLRFSLSGQPVVAVIAPIAGADPRYRAIVTIASLQDARDAAHRAGLALALAGLVACAVLVLALHLLIGQITRPLEQLAAFAASIDRGQRGPTLALTRTDEVGTLARALDEMAERIVAYDAELAARSRLSALGEMAARIAHEVRNPLTGLKMHLELLAERAPATELARIRMLLAEVRRLELIVESSLTLARPRVAAPEPTDLAPLIEEVASLMRPALAHRRIELATRVEPLPTLPLDRGLCRQALLNLIVNAADALPDGGRILVTGACERDGGAVMLAVEDSGPGLDAAVEDQLGAASGSVKPFGLGLGLSVCREFALAHGGRLASGGRSTLGGARIIIELPDPRDAPARSAVS